MPFTSKQAAPTEQDESERMQDYRRTSHSGLSNTANWTACADRSPDGVATLVTDSEWSNLDYQSNYPSTIDLEVALNRLKSASSSKPCREVLQLWVLAPQFADVGAVAHFLKPREHLAYRRYSKAKESCYKCERGRHGSALRLLEHLCSLAKCELVACDRDGCIMESRIPSILKRQCGYDTDVFRAYHLESAFRRHTVHSKVSLRFLYTNNDGSCH